MINKRVLIVGGSSGLGIHITRLYLKKKYNVTTISRNKNIKISKKVKQIICDVTDANKLKELLKNFKKDNIKFDIIIHNVGGSKKVYDYNTSSYNYNIVWNNNLGYVVDINNFFIPFMKKKKWGRIVHISSSAAYNFSAPVAYSSAKAALKNVSEASRKYLNTIAVKMMGEKIVIKK